MVVVQYTYSRKPLCCEWTVRVFEYIEREKSYFKILANILTSFYHFHNRPSEQIKKLVELMIMADPKLRERNNEEKKAFVQLMDELYKVKTQYEFENYRANILEQFVWRYGPFLLKASSYERYKEPILKTPEGDFIGQSDSRFDVIFHAVGQKCDTYFAEYIECKVRADNFISADNYSELRQKQKRKLKYIQDVWDYFEALDYKPILAVACLNGNISIFRERLDRWGFTFLRIYNRDVLLEKIS